MIVAELLGGLGNQMFQYAAGKALSQKLNQPLFLSTHHFERYKLRRYELQAYSIEEKFSSIEHLKHFNLIHRFKDKSFLEKLFFKFYPPRPTAGWVEKKEKEGFIYDSHFFDPSSDHIYLSGFWQSPKYFDFIDSQVRSDFTLKNPPTGRNRELLEILENKKAVSVHVRRGDYVSNPSAASFHGSCSMEYYRSAAAEMVETIKPDAFVVFSDEISWCKENLRLPIETIYADHNSPDQGQEDIRLMQNCRGHIIANSSFSWWGAWLAGKSSERVIAPPYWTKQHKTSEIDVLPESWAISSVE